MCGIFGIIGNHSNFKKDITSLAKSASRRGKDSSGILINNNAYAILTADYDIRKLIKKIHFKNINMILGIGRLITNGNNDNQPYKKNKIIVFHNGIVLNDKELFLKEKLLRNNNIDTEIIAALAEKYLDKNNIENTIKIILSKCEGMISSAICFTELGKLVLFTNNGSLYYAEKKGLKYFSSEAYHLKKLGCINIEKVIKNFKIIDIPKCKREKIEENNFSIKRRHLLPEKKYSKFEKNLLNYTKPILVRCTKCLLPHTMPFIKFDSNGVCNYCLNYDKKNKPRNILELKKIVKKFKNGNNNDCIVPFSGGRDSSFGLHLIVKELELNPITYTYDWGMTSDIGRKNISLMCSKLGIENIIVAADIKKKRENIKKNVEAWLKNPHLGMISLFTAGDKHFYQFVENIKKETGINLNIWGSSPYEITHFKSGYLGIKPDFFSKGVYSRGILKQLNYQYLRFKQMFKNPYYFNSSLWDTILGEYYRSIKSKSFYHYIFDYWKWDEEEIEKVLVEKYDWILAEDTKTSWRIGDGTASFYNYIYYTVAGFTEHDTFRSNQIREGVISRDQGLKLIEKDNIPRYESINEYFDLIGVDFEYAIKTINKIPKLWYQNPR